MALVVCETFASLMGESTRAGVPAYFIRLTGCNLRCRYCDTAYAYEDGSEMTVAALVEMVRAQPYRLVLVTGGEPLLQAQTPALLTDLLDAGFTVVAPHRYFPRLRLELDKGLGWKAEVEAALKQLMDSAQLQQPVGAGAEVRS